MTWRKYIVEFIAILLLFAGGFLMVSLTCNWFTARNTYEINEIESNLFFIHENEEFDLTILGISHARNFSRQANHYITETILEKKVMNLGRGNALCGMEGQALYFDFFCKKGNETKQAVFVASPPLMYGSWLDSVDIAFWDEPIRFDFLSFYLNNSGWDGRQKMFYYFRNKLRPSWLNYEKYPNTEMTVQLEKTDSFEIAEGFRQAYKNGMSNALLERNFQYFEKIAKMCEDEKTELFVIIPPAVFGKWSGHEDVWNTFIGLQSHYDFKLYDFSESILEPKFYRDHHHLNTDGVRFFLKEKLKPILNKGQIGDTTE